MTERESAHPPPQRLDEPSAEHITEPDSDPNERRSADRASSEPRTNDRLLPTRAGPDGEDRSEGDSASLKEEDGDKRSVSHVSKLS